MLIITYYWPPSGGSPVLRWLKFVKYLHKFGWEVTVYTPANPEPQAVDETLLEEIPEGVHVIKKKIREPYAIFKRILGKPKGKSIATAFISDSNSRSLLNELLVWVRGNFFIPDARKFWIKPSVRYLSKYLKQFPHHVMVSTGPPHSMHLIAQGIKSKTGIPWLADFRDPWTNIDYYSQLKLTQRADRKHHQLESDVIRNADAIVTVSPTMTKEYKEMGSSSVHTITNGFDVLPGKKEEELNHTIFSILHVGSMPESRNPKLLWKVLGKFTGEASENAGKLRIELIGHIDSSIIESLKANGLEGFYTKYDYLPNREVLLKMTQASVLLLVINNTQNATGILTNKFFEYLSAKRPILAIGPTNGDAAEIINMTRAGKIFDYKDEKGMDIYLHELISDFNQRTLKVDPKNIDTFSRRNLTSSLAKLLDSLAK